MRCAIYLRVSSKSQEEADTIGSQRLYLPEWARRQGWSVVAEFEDVAIPGRETEKRDGLMGLLAAAKQKPRPFDVLLIRDWSRLARTLNIMDQAAILGTFQDAGIKIAELGRGFVDLSNSNDLLMAQIQLWQAAVDNENRAKAVRQGHRRVREKGGYSGKRPYGLTYDAKAMEFGVDKKRRKTLETMLRLLAQGWGLRAVAKVLNGNLEKYPLPSKRGTRWWQETIRGMVLNDFYHTGIITPTNPDLLAVDTGVRMFPEALVMDARREMGIRRRRKRKTRKQPGDVLTDYLLVGMLRCSECGRTLGPNTQRRRRGETRYYVCRGRAHDLCTSRMFRADRLEDSVWRNFFDRVVCVPHQLEAAILAEEFLQDANREELQDMAAQAEAEIAELDRAFKASKDLYRWGDDTRREFEEKRAEINQRRREAEQTLRRAREQLERPGQVREAIREAVRAVADEALEIILAGESDEWLERMAAQFPAEHLERIIETRPDHPYSRFARKVQDVLVRGEVREWRRDEYGADPEVDRLVFHQRRNLLKALLGPQGCVWVKGRWSGGKGERSRLLAFSLEFEGNIQVKQLDNIINTKELPGL